MTAYLSLQTREEVAQYFSSAEIKNPKLYMQRKYPSELKGNQDILRQRKAKKICYQ